MTEDWWGRVGMDGGGENLIPAPNPSLNLVQNSSLSQLNSELNWSEMCTNWLGAGESRPIAILSLDRVLKKMLFLMIKLSPKN